MTEYQEKAIAAIEAQQAKVKERSPQWMVGEQLKDICRMEPHSAELIAQDLQVKEMGIVEAEKKLKTFADSHKAGGFACVIPAEADRILREFYGLPAFEENHVPREFYGLPAARGPSPNGLPPELGGGIDPLDFL